MKQTIVNFLKWFAEEFYLVFILVLFVATAYFASRLSDSQGAGNQVWDENEIYIPAPLWDEYEIFIPAPYR